MRCGQYLPGERVRSADPDVGLRFVSGRKLQRLGGGVHGPNQKHKPQTQHALPRTRSVYTPYTITHLNGAPGEDLSPQATAVREPANHVCCAGQPFKMRARLAKPEASQGGLAYLELAAYQVVERDPAGHNVATWLAWRKPNTVIALQCFQRLDLDERNLVIRFGLPEGAQAKEVPVPFESLGGDGPDFFHALHRSCRAGSNMY